MRLIRSSLSLIYLTLAVLLPWLHMPMHGEAHQHESNLVSSCGHNHAAPASEQPESEEPHHHDDCSLCELILVPADLPELCVHIKNTGISIQEAKPILLPVDEPHFHHQQARAPPFQLI
ncbi:hypothetical protein P4C99_04905 [Pontiellaceae bacterium B1224]|nr:hypothetical protein [Pontiellaceae bacterium B1224]